MNNDIQKKEKQRIEIKGYRPITFLTVVLVLTWVSLIWFGWNSWNSYHKAKIEREYHLEIEKLRFTIIHLDEVLTMSARMAAATGNLRWEERYRIFEPKLDAAIKEAMNLAPKAFDSKMATDTDASNIRLVEMENRSFDLVRQGHIDEAKALLFSDEYEEQKRIYAQGMTRFSDGLSATASTALKYEQRGAFLHVGMVFLLIPLLIIVWLVAFRVVRRWVESLISSEELQKEIGERKQVEEALKKERDKSQQYLDVAGVVFVSLDRDQKVILINRKGCEVLGYSEDEIIGKNWFNHFLPKTNISEVKEVYDKIISGNIEPVEYCENSVLTKDGSEKIIAWHNSIMRDESGRIIGLLSSGEDITGRKHAEEEKKKLEAQLQQAHKMEAIGTMAGGIAHDFNNILSPIMIHSEMAMMDLPPDSPVQHNLEEIFKAGKRARDTVKNANKGVRATLLTRKQLSC